MADLLSALSDAAHMFDENHEVLSIRSSLSHIVETNRACQRKELTMKQV